VLGPRVVLRRSLQYALASRTLTVLGVLPAIALFLSLIRDRSRTVGDIFTSSAGLYIVAGERKGGWLLVPVAESRKVGVLAIEGWEKGLTVSAQWEPTASGYGIVAEVALPAGTTEGALDVIVNETAPGRERRRGQLVLSGARGEFVYLRGDRHDVSRLLRFSLS